jgi:ABC-type phosphate transport system auxiliary subunit
VSYWPGTKRTQFSWVSCGKSACWVTSGAVRVAVALVARLGVVDVLPMLQRMAR